MSPLGGSLIEYWHITESDLADLTIYELQEDLNIDMSFIYDGPTSSEDNVVKLTFNDEY